MQKSRLYQTLNALRNIPFNSAIMKGKLVQLKNGRVVILHKKIERPFTYDMSYENKMWGYKMYQYSELKNDKFITTTGLFNPSDFVLQEEPTTMLLIDNLRKSVGNK